MNTTDEIVVDTAESGAAAAEANTQADRRCVSCVRAEEARVQHQRFS